MCMITNVFPQKSSTVENRRRRTSVSLGKRAQQLECAAERSAKLLKLPPLSFVFSEDEFCACENSKATPTYLLFFIQSVFKRRKKQSKSHFIWLDIM